MTVPHEFMMTVHLFMHGDNYNLDALKEAVPQQSEWIERVQQQFDEVLRTRPVTVGWYIEHANADLGDEETFVPISQGGLRLRLLKRSLAPD